MLIVVFRDVLYSCYKVFRPAEDTPRIPFWEMSNADDLCSSQDAYVFCKKGDTYIVYLKNGQACSLDLTDDQESFQMQWFNPRSGKFVDNEKNIV